MGGCYGSDRVQIVDAGATWKVVWRETKGWSPNRGKRTHETVIEESAIRKSTGSGRLPKTTGGSFSYCLPYPSFSKPLVARPGSKLSIRVDVLTLVFSYSYPEVFLPNPSSPTRRRLESPLYFSVKAYQEVPVRIDHLCELRHIVCTQLGTIPVQRIDHSWLRASVVRE